MRNKYTIDENSKDKVVSICLCNPECGYFDSFIDIWVDDDENPSPFENMDTARQFAEIIVKLLEVVS